jgi:dTDP-4-amino-4,6-dideoxygalactose transaminase
VQDLEDAFRDYTGNKFALALNSATSALYLSVKCLDLRPGDEIITTPFTFASTASVIVLAGAKPVFCDIERDTLNLDPEQVESSITERTRAVILVHFAGRPARLEAFRAIAERYKLKIIEDAAHAVGSSHQGEIIGCRSEFAAFSFYPTKNMTAAEGGMLVTSDEDTATLIRKLRWYGLAEGIWDRSQRTFYDASEVLLPSLKFNMSDLQAAIGLCQFRKLGVFNEKRLEYVNIYGDLLEGIPEISLPPVDDFENRSSWHLFVIRIKSRRFTRADFCAALAARGIGTSYHYKSLHLHEYFRNVLGHRDSDFPNATAASEEVVSLPLYPRLTAEDVEYVAESIRSVTEGFVK